jgi:hypothetical protein
MIEPVQVVVNEPISHLRILMDVLQLFATVFLGLVAIFQAKAARSQANAANTQARAAHASLKQSLRPRLKPARWEPRPQGGRLTMQNVGSGSAYALRWRFDREWHWTEGEDLLPDGDVTVIDLLAIIAERKIVVEYSSADEEVFCTTVNPLDLYYVLGEPGSDSLIPRIRARQQGR